MKYRLANFCDKVCKEHYEEWIKLQPFPAQDENHSGIEHDMFRLVVKQWELYRTLHERCFSCSSKLPASRTRTIG
jgi:hypothetical protein